jgi:hypothetical protein
MKSSHKTYVSTAGAAEILGVSRSFLDHARIRGDGPPFVKFGRIVRYEVAALASWAKALTITSTAK